MVSTDREALVSLFRSTGGAGWIRRENWDTDAYLATWNGVKVNDQGRVVNLDLKYNNLQGSIPPELGKLAALRELDLHGNQLTGRIPKELGDLTELKEVTLYHNNLTGRIPEEMGNLKALTHLLLNHNSLEGPIPLELGNLAAVQHLSLQDNQLSGEIPASLGQFSELQQLILWKNRLSGTIPEALGNLSALVSLRLSDISLEGPRPKELGNLTQLKLILHNNLTALWDHTQNVQDVDHNEGGDSMSGGPIPSQLCRLLDLLNSCEAERQGGRFIGPHLSLDSHPWAEPPESIVAKGLKSVRGYFEDLFADDCRIKRRGVKVVLVGQEGAGKTRSVM